MRIGIIGARGMSLPGRTFGGFETFIAGLAPRLAQRGHDVTVYARTSLYPDRPHEQEGVRLRWLRAIEGKAVGTPSHTLLAAIDVVRQGFDAVLVVNPGNGFQCAIPRVFSSIRLVMNVDGVEWERGKWGYLGRWYFRMAARAATKICHVIVADSQAIADLYLREFACRATVIPYAFDPRDRGKPDRVVALGLQPGGYYLVVGRLIPENNAEYVVQEFAARSGGRPVVVVGGTNYESAFHRELASYAGERVRFLGHVDDMELLWDLYGHAYAYIHGHSVGGTNPALLQAMATQTCPVIFDVVYNREVAGPAGVPFRREPGSLRAVVERLDRTPEEVHQRGELARQRLVERYSWERVVTGYESALGG